MCVIYEPASNQLGGGDHHPSLSSLSRFTVFIISIQSSGAHGGYLLVKWNVALMRRGQTCVADCTHFHLISF